jgi:hypothetical protein
VNLRTLFKPIADGAAKRPATPSRKQASPNLPRAEDLVSPLKAELLLLVQQKALRCSYHCTGCTFNTGGKCALDISIANAVTTKDDPMPWAAAVITKVDALMTRMDKMDKTLDKTEEKMKPIQTLRRAVYWGLGSGMFTAGFLVVKYVLGIP